MIIYGYFFLLNNLFKFSVRTAILKANNILPVDQSTEGINKERICMCVCVCECERNNDDDDDDEKNIKNFKSILNIRK